MPGCSMEFLRGASVGGATGFGTPLTGPTQSELRNIHGQIIHIHTFQNGKSDTFLLWRL